MTGKISHGGARAGSGRKPKLTLQQELALQQRYQTLMFERAKERAIRQQLIGVVYDDPCDYGADNELDELRKVPISERSGQAARDAQSSAAGMIRRRVVQVGTGRGPSVQSGPFEPSALDIREQVACEANKDWGRKDITPRMVRRACEKNYTDEQIVADYLDRQSKKT